MPEGVHGYPKWTGTLRTGPAFPVIVREELIRAWNGQWSRLGFYAPVFLGLLWFSLYGRGEHTLDQFLLFLSFVSYGGVALGVVVGGPALLDDQRRGALDLYLSRAVTRVDYLVGKVLAVFLAAFGATFAMGLAYWGATWMIHDTHPPGWAWIPLGLAGYCAIWGLVVTALSLGLAALFRSSAAATLTIAGAFFVLDVLVSEILSAITRNESLQVVSPLADAKQQAAWLFRTDAPFAFPVWWAAIALGILVALGIALVAWKHPRLKGVGE